MDPATFDRLRHLDLTVARRVEGLLQGDHRGLLPGPGQTPGEARPYQPGDDVRRIDWNVTARTQRTHVRDTEADHELETTLVVDVSASMRFGTARGTKMDVALAVAAVYGFASLDGGNRVGAIVLGNQAVRIPGRSGRAHLYAVLGAISEAPGGGHLDLTAGLSGAARTRSRRGLVVVISDFLDEGPWDRPLRMLTHRHEVVAAVVSDPRELSLPNVGVVRMEDPETGRQSWVDTASRRFRSAYDRAAEQRRHDIERRIIRSGAHLLPLTTGRDWVGDIVTWVMGRRAGAAATGRTA
jgi:uncharacterized protein (DUF58 family)